MKLFVANCSIQDHDFAYRQLETGKLCTQRIHAGSQSMIYKDAPMNELELIIQQHLIYGMIPAQQAKNAKGFVGLCYSIDKPVDVEAIMHARESNDNAAVDRAVEVHQTSVASATDAMQKMSDGKLNDYEVELTEQVKTHGTVQDGQSATIGLAVDGKRGRGRPSKH